MARDAAEISPKMIPDDELLPRDNSGGIDFENLYTAQWDDGGRVTGPKSHLSAEGGGSSKTSGDQRRPQPEGKGKYSRPSKD